MYEQGCYMRNEKDFNTSVTLKNMTQDICVTYCRSQGAWYAALRVRASSLMIKIALFFSILMNTKMPHYTHLQYLYSLYFLIYFVQQNRSECYCSSTFHIKETEPSNTMPCNLPCPGNYSQDCGSQHSAILVLNVYGNSV